LITTGVVDLPSVGKARQRPQSVIEIVIGSDEKLKLKRDGQTEATALRLADIAERVKAAQDGDAQTPVVISADRNVKYDSVVKVMDSLQRSGVQRVGLSVKTGS
jgi:biopolymer transport protein TolR